MAKEEQSAGAPATPTARPDPRTHSVFCIPTGLQLCQRPEPHLSPESVEPPRAGTQPGPPHSPPQATAEPPLLAVVLV